MKKIAAFFSDMARIFQTPFAGLSIVIWCYFVFCYMALPHNPTWGGDLPDPDDFTYLTQTLDWLQGQGWFDVLAHRIDPPDGTAIHYTRLAELPIATMIMLFRALHYSWRGAALLASFVLPLVYLGFLFSALCRTAAKIIDPNWARLTCFVALFASPLTYKFAPGQVDHHGLEAILTIIATGFMFSIFTDPRKILAPLAAGFFYALSVGIALETLPWMALGAFVVGLWVACKGAKAARATVLFGGSLFVCGVVFLLLEKPLVDIFKLDLLTYSFAYALLEAAIALSLMAAAATAVIKKLPLRLVLSAFFAAAFGALYLYHFPLLLAGPYGAMEPRLASMFFTGLSEAQPLTAHRDLFTICMFTATCLLALGSSIWFMRDAKADKKWGWLLLTLSLTAALAFAIFYQLRVIIYAMLFAIIPLTGFFAESWRWIGRRKQWTARRKVWAEIGLLFLIGPLTVIFLPALFDNRSFNSGIMIFAAQESPDLCHIRNIDKVLNAPPYVGRNLRIMNFLNEGPEILFYTDHQIFAAPYHTNVTGNLTAVDFFSSTDATDAEKIARRNKVDLVLLCRSVPQIYTPSPEKGPGFAERLARNQIPAWLKEIPVPQPADYRLFEMK